jgi:hypothetical protein
MITEADQDNDGEINQDEFLRIMKKTCLYWIPQWSRNAKFVLLSALSVQSATYNLLFPLWILCVFIYCICIKIWCEKSVIFVDKTAFIETSFFFYYIDPITIPFLTSNKDKLRGVAIHYTSANDYVDGRVGGEQKYILGTMETPWQ